MGAFDYCWQMYAQQVLQGAVSKAGRDSTLEAYASSQADLDTLVREQVQQVFANAEVTFSRKAYDRFDQVGVEERYTDENENGSYDIGECYDDSTGTGQRSAGRRVEEECGSTGRSRGSAHP